MSRKKELLRVISTLFAVLTMVFVGQPLTMQKTHSAQASAAYDALYDLDGNGRIDDQDIRLIAPDWGSSSPTASRDLNHDGKTNIFDIMLVASRWGTSASDLPSADVSSQKKGVGVPSWEQGYWKNITEEQLASTHSKWFYDWGVTPRFFKYSAEYVPMIWSDRLDWYGGEAGIAAQAAANPGRYWLIWNEPDLSEQANITPQRAAELYRSLEQIILGADPTAKLIVGGISQMGWPEWPQQFLDTYKSLYGTAPRLAGWHIHFYPIATADSDPQVLAERTRNYVMSARAWVDSHGGGELWLTEFNVHTTDGAAQAYMSEIVPWLEGYSGINRYAWFAIDTTFIQWNAGSLMDRSFNLTPLGKLYASF
jgi:hypothetical protein